MTNNPANFSAFPTAADDAGVHCETRRSDQTIEERSVLALEEIASQLSLVHADLAALAAFDKRAPISPDIRESGSASDAGSNLVELDPDVTRFVEERFAVGTYSYTDLQHAIAEAKRARRARSVESPEATG